MGFLDAEYRQLNSDVRKSIPGKFVSLTDGVVRYELSGPANGRLLVLIHGAGLNSLTVWDPVVRILQREFQILRYDLYGQGYSDRPDAVYNPDLFIRQLSDLLAHLHLQKPFDVAGFSIGGAIATWFAWKHPEAVRTITWIAPGGLEVRLSPVVRLMAVPGIGELLFSFLAKRMAEQRYRSMQFAAGYVQHVLSEMRTLEFKGTRRALLSVLRNMPLNGTKEAYSEVGKRNIPALAVFGKEDRAVPVSSAKLLRELVPPAEIHELENASHAVVYTHAEQICQLFVQMARST